MARIKTGAVISDIRGKIGGHVFQSGPGGLVLRNNPTPTNKRNALTSQRRSLMYQLQQAWTELTASQRQLWAAWSGFSPIQQWNNAGKFLNGHQCFIQVNYYRQLYNYDILLDPIFEKSSIAPFTVSVGLFLGTLLISWSEVIDVATTLPIVSLSPPVTASTNNALNKTRQIIFTNNDTGAQNVSGPYVSLFGAIPAAGSRLYISYAIMDLSVGSYTNFANEVQTLA